MSSLGQMVAGVAHEINTPLAYVKNSLGRVAEQLPSLRSTIVHSEKLLGLLKQATTQTRCRRSSGIHRPRSPRSTNST